LCQRFVVWGAADGNIQRVTREASESIPGRPWYTTTARTEFAERSLRELPSCPWKDRPSEVSWSWWRLGYFICYRVIGQWWSIVIMAVQDRAGGNSPARGAVSQIRCGSRVGFSYAHRFRGFGLGILLSLLVVRVLLSAVIRQPSLSGGLSRVLVSSVRQLTQFRARRVRFTRREFIASPSAGGLRSRAKYVIAD